MRRPINWLVVLISAIFLFTGLTLPGCGSSGSGETVLKGALTETVANTGTGTIGRGFDAVYYVYNESVWGSFSAAPSRLNGPY